MNKKQKIGDPVGEIIECYKIDGQYFEIIVQYGEEYAVRMRDNQLPEASLDDSQDWIRAPNASFETLGGARGAILMYLEGV